MFAYIEKITWYVDDGDDDDTQSACSRQEVPWDLPQQDSSQVSVLSRGVAACNHFYQMMFTLFLLVIFQPNLV